MVIFDDGSEVNMPAAKDILPEVGRESQGASLSIKATDHIFDVEVVDCVKDTGFLGIGDIGLMCPWSFSSSSPVPCIVWVMDVIKIVCPLGCTLLDVILIPAHSPEIVVVPGLIGNPKHSRRDFSFT